MQRVTIGNAWIHSGNLTPFLRFVADRAKYELSEDEVEAIELGVRSTDQESDRWFTYEFAGASSVNLWFAIDPGTSVTFWRAECPRELQTAIEAAANLMQQYRFDIQSKVDLDKSSAIDWLSSLSPKQFAEVFYAAAPRVSQRIVETESTQSHLVLTLMSREKDDQDRWSKWDSLMICPVTRIWVDDPPICQQGEHCGVTTLSWDKRAICPLCDGEVYGT